MTDARGRVCARSTGPSPQQQRGQILDAKLACDKAGAAELHGVHHVALAVSDADAAFCFYQDVLGLTPVERPEGTRANGSWFQLGSAQVHLFESGAEDVAPPHFAIEVGDLVAAVAYATEHMPGFGYQALLRDPSGNLIELNQRD
jgi:glyoxylase I family protein